MNSIDKLMRQMFKTKDIKFLVNQFNNQTTIICSSNVTALYVCGRLFGRVVCTEFVEDINNIYSDYCCKLLLSVTMPNHKQFYRIKDDFDLDHKILFDLDDISMYMPDYIKLINNNMTICFNNNMSCNVESKLFERNYGNDISVGYNYTSDKVYKNEVDTFFNTYYINHHELISFVKNIFTDVINKRYLLNIDNPHDYLFDILKLTFGMYCGNGDYINSYDNNRDNYPLLFIVNNVNQENRIIEEVNDDNAIIKFLYTNHEVNIKFDMVLDLKINASIDQDIYLKQKMQHWKMDFFNKFISSKFYSL